MRTHHRVTVRGRPISRPEKVLKRDNALELAGLAPVSWLRILARAAAAA